MNIASLSADELNRRLRRGELTFNVGEFSVCLQSSLPTVGANLGLLYADYPLAGEPALADFVLELAPPSLARRWFRPQVSFRLDGFMPFLPLPMAQAFALFEWGLNWCVASNAHHYLVIHAAVVERHGTALILPGEPGSGKSTLCAALVSSGWRLLSDEMTLLSIDSGNVAPFPRPVSLKNASLEVVRDYAPDARFGEVVADTNKGTVGHMRPPPASVARSLEHAAPGHIVFPRYTAGADTRLERLSQGQTFMRTAENCFNYHLLGEEGFHTLARAIDDCSCHSIEYSSLPEAVAALRDLHSGASA